MTETETAGADDPSAMADEMSFIAEEAPGYSRTTGLILLLLFVYLIASFPDFKTPQGWALQWGVFYPEALRAGEFWRIITANLMHASWHHLLGNCVAIFIFGRLLEPIIQHTGMERLILLSALMTSAFSYFLLHSGTLGASGIVFGLIGAYLTIILLVRSRQDTALFWQELRGALIYLILIASWNFLDRQTVNFWGHAGGLSAGILFGFFWYTWAVNASTTQDPS